jgi:hypothetical protein
MRIPLAVSAAAFAFALAAGPAQADPAPGTERKTGQQAVVVLIGANDYGVVAAVPSRAFTPPIGTDKGSVTTAAPAGIIGVLIG